MYYCWTNAQVTFPESKLKLVDTSKFDVIEKKEAKIARLDEELNNKIKLKNYYEKVVNEYTNKAVDAYDEIDKIKAELEELEK